MVQVQKVPPLLPQPSSVPFEDRKALRDASPDANFAADLTKPPHEHRAAAAMGGLQHIQVSPTVSGAQSSILATPPGEPPSFSSSSGIESPLNYSYSDYEAAFESIANAVTINLTDISEVNVLPNAHCDAEVTAIKACNSAPSTDDVLAYFSSMCDLDADDQSLSVKVLSTHFRLVAARESATERMMSKAALVRRMSDANMVFRRLQSKISPWYFPERCITSMLSLTAKIRNGVIWMFDATLDHALHCDHLSCPFFEAMLNCRHITH
jgi:hypothetical protein